MKRDDCKIVQDLLPNYVDKLTTESTNEFIKEHLKECKKCREVYEKMSEQIDLDYNIENKEVKYMKKVHKKILIMGIIILILAIIVGISIYINYISSHMYYQKNGEIYGSDIQVSNDKNVYIEYNSDYNDIKINTKIILTLDDKNVCKNVRQIEKPNNDKAKKSLEDKYKIISNKNSGAFSNGKLSESFELSYNYNMWNGKALEDILKILDEYELNIIEY